jgi:hypothetical protein
MAPPHESSKWMLVLVAAAALAAGSDQQPFDPGFG